MVHIYNIACLYIGEHLYETKWTVPLTFRLWQSQNFLMDLAAIREVSRFSIKMKVCTQKEASFQPLRRYFNLMSSRLTPKSGQKWLGVLSEPLNLWTTKVGHFFAILFDTPTSAASKTFPVCQGCGATADTRALFPGSCAHVTDLTMIKTNS